MKRGIVDRFEGDIAVVEFDDGFERITKNRLPADVKEGDVIVVDKYKIMIDQEATRNRKDKMKGLMNKLFK